MKPTESAVLELRPAALETEARPVRLKKVQVIDHEPASNAKTASLALPGTITVFIAKKGSGILSEIRAAAKKRGDRELEMLMRIQKQFERRKKVSIPAAVKMLLAEPVFADIRYGGSTVASSLFVPDGLEVCVVTLPYNGGRLAREGFTLVEHYSDGSDVALEAIALKGDPPLTAAEKAALRQVPASQEGLNVGRAADCWGVTAIAVVAIVVLAVVAIATAGCAAIADITITERELKSIGPAASARKLLALRREVLESRQSR